MLYLALESTIYILFTNIDGVKFKKYIILLDLKKHKKESYINPLNAELNLVCRLVTFAQHILRVSWIRFNTFAQRYICIISKTLLLYKV